MKNTLEKINKILFYSGLERQEYHSASKEFYKLNSSAVRIFSIIGALYLFILYLTSYESQVSRTNRNIYLICLSISLVIFMLTFLDVFYNTKAIMLLVYIFVVTLYSFGIAVSVTQPDQIAASFMVILVVVPLMFYDRPYRIVSIVLLFTLLFVLFSTKYKANEVLDTDIMNALCFSTLSCVVNTRNIIFRTERVWFSREMQLMAEIDMLTKLKNRNCFQNTYFHYPQKAKNNISCVFIDVNGLHEYNNTKGHEAGDLMLQFISDEIAKEFGYNDSYRIGGDEFVVIICDQETALIKASLNRLNNSIESRGFHVSIGLATNLIENIDMDTLIKKADENMYEAKKIYYKNKSNDRRIRK